MLSSPFLTKAKSAPKRKSNLIFQRLPAKIVSALNGSCYLVGTKAAGANGNGLTCSVVDYLNLAYIGLPRSVGLSVGMRNVTAKRNALSAYCALCHL